MSTRAELRASLNPSASVLHDHRAQLDTTVVHRLTLTCLCRLAEPTTRGTRSCVWRLRARAATVVASCGSGTVRMSWVSECAVKACASCIQRQEVFRMVEHAPRPSHAVQAMADGALIFAVCPHTGAFVPGAPVLPVVLRYRWRHLNPPWTATNLVWHAVRHPTCPRPLQQSRCPWCDARSDPRMHQTW